MNFSAMNALQKFALDLINRQKAEIERLEVKNSELEYDLGLLKQEKAVVRTEVIKEFAERLKEELEITDNSNWFEVTEHNLVWTIDNLVKEMVGEASG